MERIPIPKGVNVETENLLNNIIDSSIGIPIILDSAPTTAGAQLKENNLGFDGTNLFITLVGSTYKIALVLV